MMMWWLLIIPGFVVLIVVVMLFTRFVIVVNSEQGYAGIRFGRFCRVVVLLTEEKQALVIKAGWWQKQYILSEIMQQPEKEIKQEKVVRKSKRRTNMAPWKIFRKIRAVLGSFIIMRCDVTIDTGNMPLNGILYPWAYLLGRKLKQNISINFFGGSTVIFEAQNTIARMLWAYIKS